jgi:riboflavin kinase/FMN adenylyltransferase
MIVVSQFADLHLDGPVLLTVGTFDGVHRGHRFLLEQAQRRAEEHGYRFLIVTFDPPPALVLRPSLTRYQLTEGHEKVRLLGELAPAAIAMLPFSRELAQLSADQFMDAIEAQVVLHEMWLGEDFHFGRGREGGLTTLVERGRTSGFSLHVVPRRMEHANSISSTRIRRVLEAGEVAEAIPLLGRPFSLLLRAPDLSRLESGVRVARYAVAPHLVLPGDGVYAGLVSRDGHEFVAAVDVQQREAAPVTVMSGEPLGEPIRLELVERLPSGHAGTAPAVLEQARDRLAHWRRPEYPAAGDY